MVDLNILIPTVSNREAKLNRLLEVLNKQRTSNVLISVLNTDGLNMTIGAKRNAMLARSSGRYTSFIDDDDLVSANYVDSILSRIDEDQSDAVGFRVNYYKDGMHSGIIDQASKHKIFDKKIYKRSDNSSFFTINKPINHLNPIKTDLAQKIGFPNIRYGEDKVFSHAIMPYLKKTSYIDEVLYHYLYDTIDNSINTFKNTYTIPGVDLK